MGIPISRLLSYYRPHRGLLVAVLACGLLATGLAMAFPLLVRYITNTVLTHHLPEALPTVYRVGAVMVLLLVLQSLAQYFVDYRGHELGARMENTLRVELFSHLQTLSFEFFDRTRSGELMSRLTNDLMLLGEFYHHAPEDYLNYLVRFVGAFTILALIDFRLTLVIFAFLPVLGVFVVVFNQLLSRTLRDNRERIADVNVQAEESLSGIRVVQSFANEPVEVLKFREASHRFLHSRKNTYRADAYLYTSVQALVQLITVAVVVLGSAVIVHGHLNLGDLITYLLYIAYVVEPIQRLAFMTNQLQEGLTGFRRFQEIMDVAPAITDAPRTETLANVRGRIEFRDVSFRYGPHLDPVLNNLSFVIEPGEYVALVGPSGAGKSTLCALVPRFYDVTGGGVWLDGHDVRGLELKSLRQSIGSVQQDVYLFAGTVMDNIRYGNPTATDEEVVRAGRLAHAHDFITRLPGGYRSIIGQRGITLSGGQRQRLSIARVFLKNPPVLIFDEATSALDYESEKLVQQSLEEVARGRTTIVIAHRLSTIRNAERIIVLTADGIVEEGTHEALMAQAGVYAQLYAAQVAL
jgi:ATP-binding cassette subfamily B protein